MADTSALAASVDVARAKALSAVPHGFLGRAGGVSTGEVAGLNVGFGSGDERERIEENRRRAVAAVCPAARLVTVYQVHSPDCVIVPPEPWGEEGRPRADAMVTDRPGVLLGILTADCAPVLLSDAEAGVVGAAHAGWKGAIAGVTDRTIEAMVSLGARVSSICAAVGPCIAQTSYEVDEAFRGRFVEDDHANGDLFRHGQPGHFQFDLAAYVVRRLLAAGVHSADCLSLDTYAAPQRYFSYRRATHRGEAAYGRQFSLIGLPPEMR